MARTSAIRACSSMPVFRSICVTAAAIRSLFMLLPFLVLL
ncbi:hypothetical protein AIOL_001922 [Candidatus Rhodobacter oscarellae]|uniref:Uncharacterized protein n=1 Tax=Candidatus Rhodobacter oscarellae TaxID=1675527 RepID=A0A0J9E566_9RHOB|nr:hypothetical protein AIOL_001922 [Candidatus Rhodobacter lobularis]